MGVTADDLLEDIKDRCFAPISQSTWTDARILRLATQLLKDYVAPMVVSVREDNYLTYDDFSVQANKQRYTLPERAVANTLEALFLVDSNGDHIRRIERTDLSHIDRYNVSGDPSDFILEGDEAFILPKPSTTENSLRMYYLQRTSDLVKTENVAKITAISLGNPLTTFTVDTDLTATLSIGDKVDIQNAQSPYKLWTKSATISGISASSIILSYTDVVDGYGNARPGQTDYICAEKTTNIPQAPEEFHSILAQKTAATMLFTLGDVKKYQAALAELKQSEERVMKLIQNRIKTQPQKVNQRNGLIGAMSGSGSRNRRNFF